MNEFPLIGLVTAPTRRIQVARISCASSNDFLCHGFTTTPSRCARFLVKIANWEIFAIIRFVVAVVVCEAGRWLRRTWDEDRKWIGYERQRR